MKIYYSASWDDYSFISGFSVGLLKSYYELKSKKTYKVPDICDSLFLDSGAFSAWNQGTEIDLKKFTQYILKNKKEYDVYVALDVITSHEQSLENYAYMCGEGLEPLPTYHYGEPLWVLEEYLKSTNYIALGGIAKLNKKYRLRWLDNIFSKYPNVSEVGFHGFGIQDKDILLRYPWQSVDATSWHVSARCGRILTPFGAFSLSEKSTSHEANRWKTNESEKKIKNWVTSLGADYEKCCSGEKEGSLERMKVNILFFEEQAKKSIKVFNNKKLQKGLFI